MIDPFWITMIGLGAALVWAAITRYQFGRQLAVDHAADAAVDARLRANAEKQKRLRELLAEKASKEPVKTAEGGLYTGAVFVDYAAVAAMGKVVTATRSEEQQLRQSHYLAGHYGHEEVVPGRYLVVGPRGEEQYPLRPPATRAARGKTKAHGTK
ncbi:hypothetical protein HNQ96_005979 [Aminobacter lissarensis]|uniref:Uncharacterized protein n=1 Tax=Aminobacter carboxidus TaxID=376165 RepID=A0A8E1WJB1_9HYPH|nr:hypothetical protein [Aminobacter lissarensis]MBB6470085.1 hypothetical protein [Aminobacter lissarensis]